MCSWCWALRPQWQALLLHLPPEIRIIKLLGGLAPDTDKPMPVELRERLQATWKRIEQTVPGIHFNFDFWSNTSPRRSTYPACRAVLAARAEGEGWDDAKKVTPLGYFGDPARFDPEAAKKALEGHAEDAARLIEGFLKGTYERPSL